MTDSVQLSRSSAKPMTKTFVEPHLFKKPAPLGAYEVAQWIIDFSFVESTKLIYGTAGDNIMFILNADTGKQLYINGRNGKAAYEIVQSYGKDTTLITDDF